MAAIWRNTMKCSITSYSKNHINLEIEDDVRGKWLLTAFYGMPERVNRRNSWNLIRSIHAYVNLPWCIIGDINDMVNLHDKKVGAVQPQWTLYGFKDVLADCDLLDLNLEGYPFMWQRKENVKVVLEERLDRTLVNSYWFQLFPQVRLSNLFSFVSYHTPILLHLYPSQKATCHRSFKFENKWLLEFDIDDVVSTLWYDSASNSFMPKLDNVADSLEIWGKKFARKFRKTIEDCKKDMEEFRIKGDPDLLSRFKELKNELAKLLLEEEVFWR